MRAESFTMSEMSHGLHVPFSHALFAWDDNHWSTFAGISAMLPFCCIGFYNLHNGRLLTRNSFIVRYCVILKYPMIVYTDGEKNSSYI